MQQNLSQIEKSVTHLLIATKQLLETLTQWSRHNATESDVSDVYVRLGYEFNIACRAFTSIGVDTSDLGPVPDLLRMILEETLSQEASPGSLDRFLPRIRDIIINLLHGLKRKQQRLRTRQAKEGTAVPGQSTRQASLGSIGSNDAGLTAALEEMPSQKQSSKHSERRAASGGVGSLEEQVLPARTSSIQPASTGGGRDEMQNAAEVSPTRSSLRDKRQPPHASQSGSSLSSDTMQALPILTPDEYKLPIQRTSGLHEPPPPPPPPKQSDALAALQRGGDLERRASRRYSAYQISKHLGASTNGVPMIPPPQNSPIPNRGRDVKESLNAVRSRSSLVLSRQRSTRLHEASPTRGTAINRISEESSGANTPQKSEKIPKDPESPLVKTPEDKLGSSPFDTKHTGEPAVSATLNGPLVDSYLQEGPRSRQPARPEREKLDVDGGGKRTSSSDGQFTPDQSPQPGKELTLFLQYKSKVKKFVLPDGANELSFARLQLAFIEKFAWNTHSNGNDLPEIYVQDPVSGVRHELESLSDVRERSVLVLNVEQLDEVKKHFDEGLGGLYKVIEGVRTTVEGQQSIINQVSQRQQDASKELARLASSPPSTISNLKQPATRAVPAQAPSSGSEGLQPSSGSLKEVQTLRRDLAVVRQTFTSFSTGITSSMAAIRTKAESVKAKAVDATIPVLEGESGRAYVNVGKENVGGQSEQLVGRVDDLQDLVEDLRKDVLVRGVRPRPLQLEQVNKDISAAARDLKKYQELVKKEKPIWTKIWEKELQTVCTDREFLTLQEDIGADLEEDLESVTSTLTLIEDAIRQQHALHGSPGTHAAAAVAAATLRSLSRDLEGPPVDPVKAKDGVLGEVRALRPNHETRLEAIARAERARQRDLASRAREGPAFKKELGEFVGEGRLKKSGGVAEADRLRVAQDERNLRDEWDSQQARKAVRAKAREEARAAEREAQRAAQDAAVALGDESLADDANGELAAGQDEQPALDEGPNGVDGAPESGPAPKVDGVDDAGRASGPAEYGAETPSSNSKEPVPRVEARG